MSPQKPIVTADIYDVHHAKLDVCGYIALVIGFGGFALLLIVLTRGRLGLRT